jgi:hypothetical protein
MDSTEGGTLFDDASINSPGSVAGGKGSTMASASRKPEGVARLPALQETQAAVQRRPSQLR